MKVCIAGKNRIATSSASYLINDMKLVKDNILVCPNTDDVAEDSWQPSLKKFALESGLEIVSLNELYPIKDLIFVSLEYNRIIKPHKFITNQLFNIHFSYLPSYKGMYTSLWPILNGENETGVTLHKIDKGIDTGDIIDQMKFNIDLNDSCRDLYFKYLDYGEKLFRRSIENILYEDYELTTQKSLNASYYSKDSIDFSQFTLDFNKTSYEIHNQIRAFIFKEYQLPVVNDQKIKKSTLTDSLIGRKAFKEEENRIILSGIDSYKIILELDD